MSQTTSKGEEVKGKVKYSSDIAGIARGLNLRGCRIKCPRTKKTLGCIKLSYFKQTCSAVHKIYLKQFATYVHLFKRIDP